MQNKVNDAVYQLVDEKYQTLVKLDATTQIKEADDAFDDLLGFLIENFSQFDFSQEELDVAFSEKKMTIDLDYLKSINPGVVTLSVMRTLLFTNRKLRPIKSIHWKEFMKKYSSIIR